jgi:hypothetical protein
MDSMENLTPPLSVHQFQKALLEKMKQYGGGIEGVWKAISPNLKYEIVIPADPTSDGKLRSRITKDAFRKQVTRLKKKSAINEKMSFGVRGNILLMMNILEILDIKSVAELLGSSFQKPNFESLLIKTNINVESLLEKFNILNDSLSLLMKQKPRIPYLKVCRDWEQILVKCRWIIDISQVNVTLIQNNASWEFYSLLGSYAKRFPKELQIAIYTCTLLNEYNEYFTKDILLHRYRETVNNLFLSNSIVNHRYIFLAPLYLLYFFFLCQKRFLSIFMPQTKLSNTESYSPFMHVKYGKNGMEINSESVMKILDGKSLVEYFNNKNNETNNDIKKILMLFEDETLEFSIDIYNEFIQLMYEIILFFFNIYNSQVNYKLPDLFDFLEQIKSLNDLYKKLSLGKPQIYYISEDHINIVINFKTKIEILLNKLSRLDKGLLNL